MRKLRDLVSEYIARGHKIAFDIRPDGGIIIKKIDGVKYSGKEGNKELRNRMGISLSEKQIEQRKRASEMASLRRQLKKTQDIFKKYGNGETVSEKNFKYRLEHYGAKGAREYLHNVSLKVRGYAPENSVDWMIENIKGLERYAEENYEESKEIYDTFVLSIQGQTMTPDMQNKLSQLEREYKNAIRIKQDTTNLFTKMRSRISTFPETAFVEVQSIIYDWHNNLQWSPEKVIYDVKAVVDTRL